MCLSCHTFVLLGSVYVLVCDVRVLSLLFFFFFQAEDGIRDLVRSRGLGDVYKRQLRPKRTRQRLEEGLAGFLERSPALPSGSFRAALVCLLYTSDAADERSSVDLGGRRIIKKKKREALAMRVSKTRKR